MSAGDGSLPTIAMLQTGRHVQTEDGDDQATAEQRPPVTQRLHSVRRYPTQQPVAWAEVLGTLVKRCTGRRT